MKVAILAGGYGTRMGAITADCPKPMIPIGDTPVLWHLIRYFESFGHREFVVAAGYRGETIHRWFCQRGRMSETTNGPLNSPSAVYKCNRITIRVVDTGPDTNTGGRVGRLSPWLREEPFLLTWGDGLSDVDLTALRRFHQSHDRLLTVTAVRPPERFGRLQLNGNQVQAFIEKPRRSTDWINGAFFVVNPEVLECIHGDGSSWEYDVMTALADQEQIMAWRHESFWQCMDTPGEHHELEKLWQTGTAPWKRWK